jgi:HK97 family phage major capsid protein
MPTLTNTRVRAERLMEERVKLDEMRENLIADANSRGDSTFTDSEEETLKGFRERSATIDAELATIGEDLEREQKAEETSKLVRGHMAGHAVGVEKNGEEIVYRTFSAFARDKLISEVPDIRSKVQSEMGPQAVQEAQERLHRAPAHTLTSDIGGLLPPTHIQQIMDVIDAERPVVASANRVDLSSGKLTWPKITTRPIVGPQATEKTETDSQKMGITMEDANADTYLGAGNLSWQAINWSTPSALDLFFRLMGEAYARQTEAVACHVLAKAAATISAGALAGSSSDTFEDWIGAVLAGFEQVYDATRAKPDTLYLSVDMFMLSAALTSTSGTKLIDAGNLSLPNLSGRIAGLNVVTSIGFETGTAIVGDSKALLVGETPGAPVQLRAVEPSIGGLEVGVIGAFKAISFDDERFADVGPAT